MYFCYCIFVTLLQIIGNYVISDEINIITLISTSKHYDHQADLGETQIALTWRILVDNIMYINEVQISVFDIQK